MNPVASRLNEERNKWRRDPPEGFIAGPAKNMDGTLDLFKWECDIPGPRHSVLEDGRFKFHIYFDRNSLNVPPDIFFDPVVFHPNVSSHGYVCSTLRHLWPNVSIKQLVFAVQSFLEMPNPASPLNSHAAHLYLTDRKKYDECARDGGIKKTGCS